MTTKNRTLVILGPDGAGKKTTIGCILDQFGGIDVLTVRKIERIREQRQEQTPEQKQEVERVLPYDQFVKYLNSLNHIPTFATPKKHQVTIADPKDGIADCAIIVLSADTNTDSATLMHYANNAKNMIILVNKMDKFNWSENTFQETINNLGIDMESVPVIPTSAWFGDNFLHHKSLSSKSPWYTGWHINGRTGTSLIEALDLAFEE